MKKIVISILSLFILFGVSYAATPKYITVASCNLQIQKQVKQTKFLLGFAEAVTYDHLSYTSCLWELLRGEDVVCDGLYEGFKNSYNYGKGLGLFSKFGWISDYE